MPLLGNAEKAELEALILAKLTDHYEKHGSSALLIEVIVGVMVIVVVVMVMVVPVSVDLMSVTAKSSCQVLKYQPRQK